MAGAEDSAQTEKAAGVDATVEDRNESDELQFEDQSSRMPLRKILIVYLGIGQHFHTLLHAMVCRHVLIVLLGLALMVAFMDQTAVSTATPVIANDLNASQTISWVGTAFFVGKSVSPTVFL